MGQYLGSWKIDDYLTIPAVTHRFSSGVAYAADPITVRIYKDDGATQIVTDQAMTNFDSITGLYIYKQQLTAAAGFVKGSSYTALIQATVDSIAAIDVHTFQIEAEVDANTVSPTVVAANVTQWNSAAVATPTVAGVPEVDVHAWNGTAIPGVDTAGYPKVTIKEGAGTGELLIEDGLTGADVVEWAGAALPTLATTADIWGYTAGEGRTLTSPKGITSNDQEIELGSDNKVTISNDVHTSRCTVAAVTGNVGGNVVGTVASVGTVTGNVNGNVTGNVGGNVTGSVGSVAARGITADSIDTDAITAAKIADGAIDAGSIATSGAEKIADALLDRDMSTGTDTGSATVRTPRQALRILRNKWANSAGALTVYKEDDTTESWTSVLTQTAVNPVTASDPASS